MNEYEIFVILRADLDDEAKTAVVDRISEMITNGEAKPEADHWGQRQLAYEINKQRDGYYILFGASPTSEQIVDFERNMMYADEVLRHMVIRKPELVEATPAS